jgi:hypothetical protein
MCPASLAEGLQEVQDTLLYYWLLPKWFSLPLFGETHGMNINVWICSKQLAEFLG